MKKAYIVGISGESASGKSTITDCLKVKLTELKVKLIHMDDYYKEELQRPVILGLLDGKQYVDDNHPDCLNLDKFYSDLEKTISEDWDVILIEGIFTLWDKKILPLLDLKIFVDCDSDERLVRRIKRHNSIGQSFDAITQRYIQAVQPRQKEYVEPTKWKADIILNGFQMSSLGIEIILTWIYKMKKPEESLSL